MPTGGVEATQASIVDWFKAGVAAVGIGSDLVRKEWVKNKDFQAISQKTEEVTAWIKQARG
jgi:2-dehydro-3-deoxyphosphogluconate aldolase/(4S)-4-hydroxy-2-oxoglutarate aldolase